MMEKAVHNSKTMPDDFSLLKKSVNILVSLVFIFGLVFILLAKLVKNVKVARSVYMLLFCMCRLLIEEQGVTLKHITGGSFGAWFCWYMVAIIRMLLRSMFVIAVIIIAKFVYCILQLDWLKRISCFIIRMQV
jgi:hypothetical protein